MFLESNEPNIKALSLSLHQAFISSYAGDSIPLQIADSSATQYAELAFNSLRNGDFILPLTAKTIQKLTPVQLWALDYVGVMKLLNNQKKEDGIPYTIQSALTNFREKFPGHDKAMENITQAEIVNIVFETEFDLVFALIGIEHMLNVKRIMFASKQS